MKAAIYLIVWAIFEYFIYSYNLLYNQFNILEKKKELTLISMMINNKDNEQDIYPIHHNIDKKGKKMIKKVAIIVSGAADIITCAQDKILYSRGINICSCILRKC